MNLSLVAVWTNPPPHTPLWHKLTVEGLSVTVCFQNWIVNVRARVYICIYTKYMYIEELIFRNLFNLHFNSIESIEYRRYSHFNSFF